MMILEMVLPSSGKLSLYNIQLEFGGTNPVSLSEYYQNNASRYTAGVSGIPNSGAQISFSQFYNKRYLSTLNSGNAAANLDTTGGNAQINTDTDDGYVQIANIDFPFFWLGVNYGNNNNNGIYWNTNQAITFGNYSIQHLAWSPSTARGILLGKADKDTKSFHSMPTITRGSYKIKRLVIYNYNHATSWITSTWEIKLVRGDYQYIELRVAAISTTNFGQWVASDNTNWFDIFGIGSNGAVSTSNPISVGESLVLRSDLNGNNWTCFKNHYLDNYIFVEKTVTLTTSTFDAPGVDGEYTTWTSPAVTIPSDFIGLISWDLIFNTYKRDQQYRSPWGNYYNFVYAYMGISETEYGTSIARSEWNVLQFSREWTNQTYPVGSASQSIKFWIGFYTYANLYNCSFSLVLRYKAYA